jgi:hypothetical protein
LSKVAITGNVSGTGTLTIAAPNTNTDRTLTLPDNTGTMMLTNTAVAKSQLPAGSVLQVLQTVKTDTFSTASTSATDLTGLSVSITPTSASSKILVMYDVKASIENAQMSFFLVRGSTTIYIGDSAGSRIRASSVVGGIPDPSESNRYPQQMTAIYLDSPATTSATTYKIQCQVNALTGYVNRSGADQDDVFRARVPSSITVMEIAA